MIFNCSLSNYSKYIIKGLGVIGGYIL